MPNPVKQLADESRLRSTGEIELDSLTNRGTSAVIDALRDAGYAHRKGICRV